MKKVILLFAVVILSSCATHTTFHTFYKENNQDSELAIGLNSSLINSFLPDEDFEEVKHLLKKAKHYRIMVFSENSIQMDKKFNKFINHSKFDKLVKVKDNSDHLSLYTLEENDKIKEIVVQIFDGDDLILLGLKTNLDQEDLVNLLDDNKISMH